ncbi:RadC family protein [Sodaliphilus pleomorphus]|uniref:RadC family protein n=1 Tax=Sodaliphilus pleomorphus TaxID=2606626 RepID=UPI002409791C|nr:DNA repair protein RadC [Sodaliphilus pleomorphus]MDD6686978.1 DNA repair protein RadC [Sodaliphilus pleomorphus]
MQQQQVDDNTSLIGTRTLKVHMAPDDRPREKAKRSGFAALSIAELFAIIVGSGSPGESVVDLCQRILNDNGGKLYNIARRGYKELMRNYKGIGEVKALELEAALELARRYQIEKVEQRPQITSSDDAYRYLRMRMKDNTNEQLWVVFLNRSKHVLGLKCMSQGGTSATVGDVKMILKAAVEELADTIIIAHNHPSDNPTPSPQDDALTRKVAAGCQAVGIPLVDHIIVCQDRYYSYCDKNRL